MKRLLAVATLGLFITACDRRNPSPLPTAASPVPPPAAVPQPPPAPVSLVGYVSDTAFRMLEGVTVEVTQGPQTAG